MGFGIVRISMNPFFKEPFLWLKIILNLIKNKNPQTSAENKDQILSIISKETIWRIFKRAQGSSLGEYSANQRSLIRILVLKEQLIESRIEEKLEN